VSDVKKYTPNSIANEIMAEDAWHDSLWVRDDDYEALRAELAEARRDSELLDWLEAFVAKNRVEIARSLYGSGFEFGWYPKSGPTAIARAGGIRVVLDAARKETP
jgi:hypothetical protein